MAIGWQRTSARENLVALGVRYRKSRLAKPITKRRAKNFAASEAPTTKPYEPRNGRSPNYPAGRAVHLATACP